MRHRMYGKKLNRDSGHRAALRKNLLRELFEHGRIKTTLAKAQFVRPHAERMITLAKRAQAKLEASGDKAVIVHAQRLAASRLHNDRELAHKIFTDIAPRFAGRNGGYTRILKLETRKGDNAQMVLLELVERG